jgi:hypothetical protein
MGTLGRATRLVLADRVIETPVEVELLDAGVLKVVRIVEDNGVQHRAASYYNTGEWKSFDIQTYTLVIENLDRRTVERVPGLSSNQGIHAAAVEYLTAKPVELPHADAANRANDLVRYGETSVRYSGYPTLDLKLVPTPSDPHPQAVAL